MEKKINVKRLKECREAMGYTKIEAAEKIGVSQPAYLRYEAGERQPSIQVIAEIARKFNTSVDYLMGVTNEKEPDYIIFSKTDSPMIFEVVKRCKGMDEEQLMKLLNSLK